MGTNNTKLSKEEPEKNKPEAKPSKTPDSETAFIKVDASQEEGKDGGKTKKYSDRRKEERLKREKEKADKLKKEEGIITIEDDSSRESSRDDILEGLPKATSEIITLNDTASDSAESEKVNKKEVRKQTFKERREERRKEKQAERQEDETTTKDRRESEKEKKDRKFKKPDMQIYRPGMGRFSKPKKDDEEPKTSPEESRESSPHKKVSSKPTRNKSPAEKKFRSKKKTFDDEAELPAPFIPASSMATPSPIPTSTPREEVKPFVAPDKEEEPPAPAAKGKSYRANRLAKQKKQDKAEESVGEKAEQEKPMSKADIQKEPEAKKCFDDADIPPLTVAKHVITLDNDQ